MSAPPNTRKPWTAEEDALLLDVIQAGGLYSEIGQRVGRSPFSVKLRVYKLAYNAIKNGTLNVMDACRIYRVSPSGLNQYERTRTLKRERGTNPAHISPNPVPTTTNHTPVTIPLSSIELITEIRDLLFGIHNLLDNGMMVYTVLPSGENEPVDPVEPVKPVEPEPKIDVPPIEWVSTLLGIGYIIFILYISIIQS